MGVMVVTVHWYSLQQKKSTVYETLMNVRRFRGSFVTIEDCAKVQSCVRVGEYVDNMAFITCDIG